MERKTLTLKKAPDPQKIALSLEMGFRFVDRKGRYILQQMMQVRYEDRIVMRRPVGYGSPVSMIERVVVEHTWVDIPLVPETYGEAQA